MKFSSLNFSLLPWVFRFIYENRLHRSFSGKGRPDSKKKKRKKKKKKKKLLEEIK